MAEEDMVDQEGQIHGVGKAVVVEITACRWAGGILSVWRAEEHDVNLNGEVNRINEPVGLEVTLPWALALALAEWAGIMDRRDFQIGQTPPEELDFINRAQEHAGH